MLKQVFQKIYVINLAYRKDRLERFYYELPVDWPFEKPERFPAVDGKTEVLPQNWRSGPGAWGCYQSHLAILEDCLANNVHSVLIMEDDALCLPDFRKNFEAFWRELPNDTQMIYLGGQHIHLDKRLPRKVSKHVYRPFNVNRTHSYGIFGREMLETTYWHLSLAETFHVPQHVDHFLGVLHETMVSGLYVPDEWLMTQAGGVSDITRHCFDVRNFDGAAFILAEKVDKPCIALVGMPGCGMELLAKGLHCLGVTSSAFKHGSAKAKEKYFCETIAESCFDRTTLTAKLPDSERIALLRYWAKRQIVTELSRKNKSVHPYFCGFDPLLSLMIPEVMKAWNNPFIIMVDRPVQECMEQIKNDPRYQPSGDHETLLKRMANTMNINLDKYKSHVLPTSWEEITQHAELLVERICFMLDYRPTSRQYQETVDLFQSAAGV